LPLGKKDNISIPEVILNDDLLLKSFIRGFMATDGSVNKFMANKKTTYPRIQLSNVSEKLMKQISKTLKRFGFRVTVWIADYSYYGWNKSYRISINGQNQLRKWHDEIGFINPKQEKTYLELVK
jgi:flagellar protein FlaI